jgi:glycosyltransferase involved in cell wall biosynthesis
MKKDFFALIALYKRKFEFKFSEKVNLTTRKPAGKKALVSYVVHPFIISEKEMSRVPHTNPFECLDLVSILLDAGYEVDVIDWTNTKFVPKRRYNLFIDVMENIERLTPLLPKECVKIFYITGAHWKFQNSAEQTRIAELKSRRGVTVMPRRQVHSSNNIELCDFAIALGSDFSKNTYISTGKEIEQIPLPWTIPFVSPANKDFEKVRKNFVWIGGGGAVHKGLDVVIECFANLPDYHLTVCGPVQTESDFVGAYKKELFETPNIRVVGRIDLRSDLFKDIAHNSLALIYPSCSEGQSGSVIAALHAGLIPLVSYESGVDVASFGKILTGHSPEYLKQEVVALSQKPIEELKRDAIKTWNHARSHYSRKIFRATLSGIFKRRNII